MDVCTGAGSDLVAVCTWTGIELVGVCTWTSIVAYFVKIISKLLKCCQQHLFKSNIL